MDDFIISRHIAALLMTQIAQTRELRELFDELLESEGYELYMEKDYFIVLAQELLV
ncbi:MAG: hypothetical protein IKN24_02545 [Lachnospiraceae bacterium]|nr:hypothetical protein [Lachnospiraceae bacterium]